MTNRKPPKRGPTPSRHRTRRVEVQVEGPLANETPHTWRMTCECPDLVTETTVVGPEWTKVMLPYALRREIFADSPFALDIYATHRAQCPGCAGVRAVRSMGIDGPYFRPLTTKG